MFIVFIISERGRRRGRRGMKQSADRYVWCPGGNIATFLRWGRGEGESRKAVEDFEIDYNACII